MTDASPARTWLGALRRYVAATGLLDLVWEFLQLPLYTIWETGSARDQAVAVLHCTAGDILIALATLVGSLIATGSPLWPHSGAGRVGALTLGAGVVYTVWSEWLNTTIRQSWSYSELMPILPPLGTGLSPVLQWIIVPGIALAWASRTPRRGTPRSITATNA